MKKDFNSKYSESWVPVKQIMNGLVQLDTGEIVTGVKVYPKNIFIMGQTQQTTIINRLQTFYNSIDYEFWLIIADRPVDLGVYLAKLQLLYKNKIGRAHV